MNIQSKTILITGGASGIGLEAAKQFLENGAKVIISGRNVDKLNAAKELYPNLTAIKSDVVPMKRMQFLSLTRLKNWVALIFCTTMQVWVFLL